MTDQATAAGPAGGESGSGDKVERHGFGAEVGRLLDLVVHSLYSEREIFLRELVANAADATDRRRFEALTDGPERCPTAPACASSRTRRRSLTIRTSGIGMATTSWPRTSAPSPAPAPAPSARRCRARRRTRPTLIGQFGVGFYAAFMVADRVEVTSRRAGTDEAWTWASEGAGEFTLSPRTRDERRHRRSCCT